MSNDGSERADDDRFNSNSWRNTLVNSFRIYLYGFATFSFFGFRIIDILLPPATFAQSNCWTLPHMLRYCFARARYGIVICHPIFFASNFRSGCYVFYLVANVFHFLQLALGMWWANLKDLTLMENATFAHNLKINLYQLRLHAKVTLVNLALNGIFALTKKIARILTDSTIQRTYEIRTHWFECFSNSK